jgi:hypothetical protein
MRSSCLISGMRYPISPVSVTTRTLAKHIPMRTIVGIILGSGVLSLAQSVWAAPHSSSSSALAADAVAQNTAPSMAEDLDLDPALIEQSPVLQRWLEEVPDLQSDIRHDPSFRTRLRIGYVNFPSADGASGVAVAVEDVFVGRSGLTISADYQTAFESDRQSYGVDARYYLLPLGGYVNVAPVLGYRSVEMEDDRTDGANVGIRFLLVPSRTGAADLAFTQTWVLPGTEETVSLSTFSFAYAVTRRLRLATDLQLQHRSEESDRRVGVGVEWMF